MRRLLWPVLYFVGVFAVAMGMNAFGTRWGATTFAAGLGLGLGWWIWRVAPRSRWPRPVPGIATGALTLVAGVLLLGSLSSGLIAAGILPEPSPDPVGRETPAPHSIRSLAASPSPVESPTLTAPETPSPTADPTQSPHPTPTPPSTPAPTPTQTPSPTRRPTATPIPTPTTAVVLRDAANDLRDEEEDPVAGPGYADILEVRVESDGETWLFRITARSELEWRDPLYEVLWIGFMIDADRDGTPDYHLSLENGDDRGQWYGGLFDVEEAYFYTGEEFPGSATPIGTDAVMRIDADAIGNARILHAAATIERQVWSDPDDDPFERLETYDTAPDHQYPEEDPDWIVVRRR